MVSSMVAEMVIVIFHIMITLTRAQICSIRMEHLHKFPGVCVPFYQSTCHIPIHILYKEEAPYTYSVANQSKPHGILIGMLEAGIESCCKGCDTKVIYTSLKNSKQLFGNNFTVYMPTSMPEDLLYNVDALPEYPFVGLISKLKVVYASVATETQVERQFNFILRRITNLWPVFAIASITTLIAGICVWLMDTWFNKSDFPRGFITGSLEGCWWAFISMTTVGYGDRTPRSFHARLFAVLWITLGITFASILTASLSSIITTVAINENIQMGGKKICIYLNTSVEAGVVYQNGGEVLAFDSMGDIEAALHNNECSGVAMESHMLLYHWNTLKRNNELEILDTIAAPDRSIGFVFLGYNRSEELSWAKYLTSFYHLNRDHKDTLLAKERNKLDRKLQFSLLNHDESKAGIFDRPTGDYVPVILYLIYVLCVFVILGIAVDVILRQRRRFKKAKKEKIDDDLSDCKKSSRMNGAFSH